MAKALEPPARVETAPAEPAPARARWVVATATLAAFLVLDTFDWALFRLVAGESAGWTRTFWQVALRDGLQVVAVAGLAWLLVGRGRVLEALGMAGRAGPGAYLARGLAVALAFTAIMPIVFTLMGSANPGPEPALRLMRGALLPGVREEIFYRAFLFGFLFRFAGWGFLPAALLGAAVFGAAHLYQSDDAAEAAAIFAITGLGGMWFAWLFVEWDYNIWVPASVHVLMNGWWEVFDISNSALGSGYADVARVLVIVASVALTVWLKRPLRVRGARWWKGAAESRFLARGT